MKGILILFGVLSFLFYLKSILLFPSIRLIDRLAGRKGQGKLADNEWTARLHCAAGSLAFVFALLHIIDKLRQIELTPGYISFFLLFMTALSGFLWKHLKERELLSRFWKVLHYLFTVVFFISLAVHLIDKMGDITMNYY